MICQAHEMDKAKNKEHGITDPPVPPCHERASRTRQSWRLCAGCDDMLNLFLRTADRLFGQGEFN